MLFVGIAGYDLEVLKAIADSKDGERVFTFENFDSLLNDISIILGESCQAVKGASPFWISVNYNLTCDV